MPEYLQVLTTAGSEEEAERISAALVERRLAARVQVVGPGARRYRRQGGGGAARGARGGVDRRGEARGGALRRGRGGDPRAPLPRGAGDRRHPDRRRQPRLPGLGQREPGVARPRSTTWNWVIRPWSSWSSMWQWIRNLPV